MRFVRKLGSKGGVTIPKELREAMELHKGDIVEFDLVAVVKTRDSPTTKVPKTDVDANRAGSPTA